VFLDSSFSRTLCSAAWSPAFTSGLGSCKAQQGCCAPGSFMKYPYLAPFFQSTACQGCPVGQFGVDNNDYDSVEKACKGHCAIGKYSDQTGLSAGNQCKDCSTGKFSNQTGLTSDSQCTKCSAGQFSNLFGLLPTRNALVVVLWASIPKNLVYLPTINARHAPLASTLFLVAHVRNKENYNKNRLQVDC
jgi:hypothetical protein